MNTNINPDYDYSLYTNLKIVQIVGVSTEIDGLHSLFDGWYGMRYHRNIKVAALCSEFLYNPQDPSNVIFQDVAMTHYRRYPIEKQYAHAKDVFRKLQQMLKLEGKQLVGKSILYLATKRYLTLVYKQFYGNETAEGLSKSQFAFLVPTFLEKDEQFINEIMRPLLLEAGWISESDLKSKLVFFGELEATFYAKQQLSIFFRDKDVPEIMREKRYMCCSIESDWRSDFLTLTLDIVQMRFDKDFVAAFGSSISSSSAQLLTPQFVVPSKTIIIPNYASKKILKLPRFLLSKIFADSPEKITFIHGDLNGFYLKNKYFNGSALKELIGDFIHSVFEYFDFEDNIEFEEDECIGEHIISFTDLFQELDPIEKKNLAAIKYQDILEHFPSVDTHRILDEIQKHAKEHELILHSIGDIIVTGGYNRYANDSGMMQDLCLEYQTLEINTPILALVETEHQHQPLFQSALYESPKLGILFKTLTMIELSNKLKEPVILNSQAAKSNLRLMSIKSKTREETILEELPGYSFYVEAKITHNHQIKSYLHQVIETQNGKEKSTLPIADTSIEVGDMYDTICDMLWNASQESSLLECASSLSAYDHYNNFRSRLLDLLTEMFNNEISQKESMYGPQNLYIGDAECSCCVQISHEMILDMGVKRYLKGIATSILACIISPATFGKYKPKVIIITGSLLSEWTKINNTLYRDFIWSQLEEELCLSIYQHQMKIHLIMSRADLDLYPDDKLIKWEKYQQVIGDKRILVDIRADAPGKLYRDEGDRYELVPAIEFNGVEHWIFLLIQSDDTLLLEHPVILSRFYINPSKDSKEKSRSVDAERLNPLYRIAVFLCSSQNQEDLLDPLTILKTEAITMSAGLYLGDIEFPIVFTIGSQNYDFRTKCSLSKGIDRYEESLFPGRITLEAISP